MYHKNNIIFFNIACCKNKIQCNIILYFIKKNISCKQANRREEREKSEIGKGYLNLFG